MSKGMIMTPVNSQENAVHKIIITLKGLKVSMGFSIYTTTSMLALYSFQFSAPSVAPECTECTPSSFSGPVCGTSAS